MLHRGFRPYQGLWNDANPISTNSSTNSITVGIYVRPTVPGKIAAIRFWQDVSDTANHHGYLAEDTTSRHHAYCGPNFNRNAGVSGSGWVTMFLHPWYRINLGDTYILAVVFPAGRYSLQVGAHSPDTDTTIGNFVIPKDITGTPNGATQTSLQEFLPTSISAAKPSIDLYFLEDGTS